MHGPLRVLELYCGVGGCASALDGSGADVVAAVDINRLALSVYAHNHPHPTLVKSIDSLSVARLESFEADLWWASPPCQPFTRRGRQKDLDDPRARTFTALLHKLAAVRPRCFAMENVVGFDTSEAREHLLRTLEKAGYSSLHETILCPSELGLPNRRPRYYAVASQRVLDPPPPPPHRPRALSELIVGGAGDPELMLDPELVRRYEGALHIVHRDDPEAVTLCFTSAYGRSHVRSGSFLAVQGGVRRFSPHEILRLLGFPQDYGLPADLPRKNAWRLVGNSLSLEPVRHALAAIPGLAHLHPSM